MKIKICGLTQTSDLQKSLSLGADYLGLIHHAASPRHVTFDQMKSLSLGFTRPEKLVLVTVNHETDELIRWGRELNIQNLQLHGNESNDTINTLKNEGFTVFKVLKINESLSPDVFHAYDSQFFLLDRFHERLHGGVGQSFDWSLLRRIPADILARTLVGGGVNTDNLPSLLTYSEIAGVDISSGVELSPGVKDHQKLTKVISLVKGAACA